jgi:hypothetical protein
MHLPGKTSLDNRIKEKDLEDGSGSLANVPKDLTRVKNKEK